MIRILILLLIISSSLIAMPFDDVLGFWDFDENGSAPAQDKTANGNDVNLVGAVRDTGKVGQALSFDGVNDHAEKLAASGLPQGSQAFTVTLWFNSKSATHQSSEIDSIGHLVSFGSESQNQWNLFQVFQGKLHAAFHSNDLQGNTLTEINTWYHAAVTFDGTTRTLYLDGAQDGIDVPTTPNVSGTNLFFGSTPGSLPVYYFDGLIDEVGLWNRALSAEEIADIHSGAATFSDPIPEINSFLLLLLGFLVICSKKFTFPH